MCGDENEFMQYMMLKGIIRDLQSYRKAKSIKDLAKLSQDFADDMLHASKNDLVMLTAGFKVVKEVIDNHSDVELASMVEKLEPKYGGIFKTLQGKGLKG